MPPSPQRLYFWHIPETAATSLMEWLDSHVSPAEVFQPQLLPQLRAAGDDETTGHLLCGTASTMCGSRGRTDEIWAAIRDGGELMGQHAKVLARDMATPSGPERPASSRETRNAGAHGHGRCGRRPRHEPPIDSHLGRQEAPWC